MTKQSIHSKEYIELRDKSENYARAKAIREKHFNPKAGIPWDDYSKAEEYMEAWGLWLKEIEAVVGPLPEANWEELALEGMTHEFDDDGNHRLVKGDKSTQWAHYTQICFLDGVVGHTAYYGVKENMVTPEEFVKMIATT
ncbi:hypothetical protein [Xanthomonas phage BUDD]|nr:hypothetical protein [Xanthomonas phage BUDD]